MPERLQMNQYIKKPSDYLLNKLSLIIENPWFAYITIVLLQLKRVWNVWLHKDLTYGDTSSYFMSAFGWVQEFSVKIHWSPLYTAYYGTLLKNFSNIYIVTLLHRYILVFLLAIMVLALMHRLMPAYIAWWVAAWWVLMPINFNSLYEVHLFAIILPLTAALVALYKPGVWSRGTALGILIASMVLVRNEVVIAVGLWISACLFWEIRGARLQSKLELKKLVFAYGVPILLAALLIAFFNWRTLVKPSPESLARKHTLNVCQIYSFGYQQRHTDWTKSPWTECQDLMVRDFGQPEPSLMEAIRLNPKAMLEHFVWNLRLTPAGLQVALFNATSAHVNPDYPPVIMEKSIVLIPSLLSIVLLITAMVQVYKNRQHWWETWIKDRSWGWLMLFCLSAVMFVVIPMQRPRPSYMFLLTLTLMALIGSSFYIVTNGIFANRRNVQSISMGLAVALILFTPSFFTNQPRPLLNIYNKIAPSTEYVGRPSTGFISIGYGQELCNYFTKSSNGGCIGYTYDIFKNIPPDQTVSSFLRSNSPVPIVTLVIEDNFLASYGENPAIQAFLQAPENEGWKMVSLQDNSEGRWAVYVDAEYFNLTLP